VLAEEGGVTNMPTLCAALLHDTLKDTETTVDELEREFGSDIVGIVAEVTDDKTLPKAGRKRRQVEHAAHISPKAQRCEAGRQDREPALRGRLAAGRLRA